MEFKSTVMDERAMQRAIIRISHEIIERNADGLEGRSGSLCLVGILRRGGPLAAMLKSNMEGLLGCEVPMGTLDISLYRDDLSLPKDEPQLNRTDINFSVEGHGQILGEDVLAGGLAPCKQEVPPAQECRGRSLPDLPAVIMIVRMGYAGPEPLGQRIPCAIGADAVKNVAADVFLFQKIQHSRQIPFSIRHVFTYISYHIARKLRDKFLPRRPSCFCALRPDPLRFFNIRPCHFHRKKL